MARGKAAYDDSTLPQAVISTVMNKTKHDLPQATRKKIVALLQPTLTELTDLRLQAKQAHWNVKGPNFIALHQLFDAVADRLDGLADTVAERITQLGGTAVGTVQAVMKDSGLPPFPTDICSGKEFVEAFSLALAKTAKRARTNIASASDSGDEATADVFTEVVRSLDKDLYFVESHLLA